VEFTGIVMSSLSVINFYKRCSKELCSTFFSDEIMTTTHRDHIVCGLCNVSFYVARRFKETDGKVYTTTPGNKVTGAAYDKANISDMLGTGPSKEAIYSVDSHGRRVSVL
jgi:hypothetical protein